MSQIRTRLPLPKQAALGGRLQAILYAWYEEIQQQALQSAVLHADETGWRVDGKTHWLWCFCTPDLTDDMIDRSRGSPALMKFFIQEFSGTLVSDFGGADNAVDCALRQTVRCGRRAWCICCATWSTWTRSEEHTSELQSH